MDEAGKLIERKLCENCTECSGLMGEELEGHAIHSAECDEGIPWASRAIDRHLQNIFGACEAGRAIGIGRREVGRIGASVVRGIGIVDIDVPKLGSFDF